jgi:transcriptional regulator with XRE-family HTH domain
MNIVDSGGTRSEAKTKRETESTGQSNLSTFVSPQAGSKLPIKAYLASALTGLDEARRKEIFEAQDIIGELCKSKGIELYQPRLSSDPLKHPGLSASLVYSIDRQRVLESDVLLVMTNEPSFGAGQELEFARNAILPIILLIPQGKTVSRMVSVIPSIICDVRYSGVEQLQRNLGETIDILMPILLQRRLEFAQYDAAVIGANIKRLREENRLTRESLAEEIGVTLEEVVNLEESPDHLSNPALILLRKLSLVLHVSLPELVVPDYAGVVASQLLGLLTTTMTPIPMRGQTEMPSRDRRRIWVRVLRRALEELEQG